MVELVQGEKTEKVKKNGIFLCKGHLSFTEDKVLPDELNNIINQSVETSFLFIFFSFVGKNL